MSAKSESGRAEPSLMGEGRTMNKGRMRIRNAFGYQHHKTKRNGAEFHSAAKVRQDGKRLRRKQDYREVRGHAAVGAVDDSLERTIHVGGAVFDGVVGGDARIEHGELRHHVLIIARGSPSPPPLAHWWAQTEMAGEHLGELGCAACRRCPPRRHPSW